MTSEGDGCPSDDDFDGTNEDCLEIPVGDNDAQLDGFSDIFIIS